MLKTVDEKMSSQKNAYKETAKTAEIVHLTNIAKGTDSE